MEGNWAISIMNIIDRLVKLIMLNLLWLLFTILGIGVFGFMPATASVYLIIRKWMNGEEIGNLLAEFWEHFKTSFVKVNLVGLVFLLIGLFLYLDFQILIGTEELIGKILLAAIMMLSLIYFATFLHFFPIFARFEMKVFDYLKLSLVMAMSNPFTTILMVLWLFVVGILSLKYTVLIPLVLVSLICLGVNWLSVRRLETKEIN